MEEEDEWLVRDQDEMLSIKDSELIIMTNYDWKWTMDGKSIESKQLTKDSELIFSPERNNHSSVIKKTNNKKYLNKNEMEQLIKVNVNII